MKKNTLDIVVGPVETYEDELFGYKAAHEGLVLVKDKIVEQASRAVTARCSPRCSGASPCPRRTRTEKPGTDSDLNAYDVLYYAGQANTGAKTIAINLPNDEAVQLKKGTRRLQLKNAMRAKFDVILMPIAKQLIADDQLPYVNFDAFFENVMFHEVAHGLGIQEHDQGRRSPCAPRSRNAPARSRRGRPTSSASTWCRRSTHRASSARRTSARTTSRFLASLFRSMRFSAADAHGRANIAAFNFLEQQGAFTARQHHRHAIAWTSRRCAPA